MLLLVVAGMAHSMLCTAIACCRHLAISSPPTLAPPPAQVVSNAAELEDYDPADICLALCRMVAYNIGQLAYMNAMKYGLKRVFFGGFFIRNHPYTMETISFAIR
jgi:pantothenate kinase